MKQANERGAHAEHPPLRELPCPGAAVVVAAHGTDGRDLSQCLEDIGASDVARVQDELATTERLERFGANETVGVGDQPELHHAQALLAADCLHHQIMNYRPEVLDLLVARRRMHSIREQHHVDRFIEIQPDRGPREAEMPDAVLGEA